VIENGPVSWKTYFTYFAQGRFSLFGWILILILFIAAQSSIVASDFWLFKWFIFIYLKCHLIATLS